MDFWSPFGRARKRRRPQLSLPGKPMEVHQHGGLVIGSRGADPSASVRPTSLSFVVSGVDICPRLLELSERSKDEDEGLGGGDSGVAVCEDCGRETSPPSSFAGRSPEGRGGATSPTSRNQRMTPRRCRTRVCDGVQMCGGSEDIGLWRGSDRRKEGGMSKRDEDILGWDTDPAWRIPDGSPRGMNGFEAKRGFPDPGSPHSSSATSPPPPPPPPPAPRTLQRSDSMLSHSWHKDSGIASDNPSSSAAGLIGLACSEGEGPEEGEHEVNVGEEEEVGEEEMVEGGGAGIVRDGGGKKQATMRQHYYPEGGWGWAVVWAGTASQILAHGLHLSAGPLCGEAMRRFPSASYVTATGRTRENAAAPLSSEPFSSPINPFLRPRVEISVVTVVE
ncbi:hypothetical protein J437_LFUL008504 [Ladona fulva]|uniref:Uncharacterized protein n=1 Tax=Ladona fulva TaxID=123851 RepID=A0A8K0K2E0_LADFU|nr:hypothetical protein J437_LFUL008504 [Ladona fulva]